MTAVGRSRVYPNALGPALLLCFGYRWFAAYLLALPLARAAEQVVGQHPRADAVLWEPGALWLSETVRLSGPALRVASPLVAAAAVLFSLGWLWPSGALAHALGRHPQRPSLLQSLGAATQQLPRLTLLYGVCSLLSALCLALALAFGGGVGRLGTLSERASELAPLLAVLPVLPVLLLIRVAQDALRLSALQCAPVTVYRWLEIGWQTLRAARWHALFAAAWRESLALALLVLSSAAAWHLSLQGQSALACAPLHAVGLTSWLLLRADWLRWLSSNVPHPS